MHDRRSILTRRRWLGAGASALAAGSIGSVLPCSRAGEAPAGREDGEGFRFALNFSTIRGQDLSLEEEIDVAAKAGYDAIEPWMGKLRAHADGGGSLEDLGRRIADHGLTVESAIGFAAWIVDDDEARRRGLEEARRDMDMLARIGGRRIAAPPSGVPRGASVDAEAAATRYRDLLEIGDAAGVVPQVEMWGGNPSIGTLDRAIQVAVRAGHPKACFLGDVYHTYKGGSSFEGLGMISGRALQVFHFNDYPADPPREAIGDRHRVHVGDGIAPIGRILEIFREVGARPVLSLELFNPDYWRQDALEVARVGLEKMREATA